MKQFTFWHTYIYAFFSKDFYRNAGRNGRGVGLLNVLFISFVLGVVIFAIAFPVVNKVDVMQFKDGSGFDEKRMENDTAYEISFYLYDALSQIPEIKIVDGELSSTVEQPYVLVGNDGSKVILDTTGEFTRFTPDLIKDQVVMIVTQYEFMTRKDNGQVRTVPFAEFGFDEEIVFDGWVAIELCDEIIDSAGATTTAGICLFVVICMFIYQLLKIIILAVVAIILDIFVKTRFDFAVMMRLSSLAMTPMLIVDIVALYMWQAGSFAFSSGVTSCINVGFILFALIVNKQAVKNESNINQGVI